MRQHDPDALLVSGEDVDVREYLESQSVARLRALVGRRTTLIVDEAQHVREVGLHLRLLVDHVPGLRRARSRAVRRRATTSSHPVSCSAPATW